MGKWAGQNNTSSVYTTEDESVKVNLVGEKEGGYGRGKVVYSIMDLGIRVAWENLIYHYMF